MKGSQESLTTVVVKDAANWLTPQSGDVTGSTQEAVVMWANGKRPKTSDQRLRTQVAAEQLKYGQAAPANPSTDGSRQGLWLTPRANEPDSDSNFVARNADRGEHCHPSLSQQAKSMWPTITAHTPDMESNGPNGHSGTYLAGAVKQWATPRAGKTTDENPETWAARQAKGDVATMPLTAQVKAWATPNAFCYQPPENTEQWTKRAEYQQTEKGVNLHKPIQTQVLHEVEKQWRTPSSSDGEGGVMEMREGCAGKYKLRDHVVAEQKAWATPIMGDSHLASTPEVAQKRIEEGKVTLSRQNPGKLNPRWVETLMGLPVGWVMPSCKSPVTIEPTNFDSSATESCLPQPSELFEF
jgi:hypothetical protein